MISLNVVRVSNETTESFAEGQARYSSDSDEYPRTVFVSHDMRLYEATKIIPSTTTRVSFHLIYMANVLDEDDR